MQSFDLIMSDSDLHQLLNIHILILLWTDGSSYNILHNLKKQDGIYFKI